MSRRRTWVYACPLCRRWVACASERTQALCRMRGACVACVATDGWRLRVHIARIEQGLETIVALGRSLPENKRDVFRRLYRKRQAQWIAAKALLEEVPV